MDNVDLLATALVVGTITGLISTVYLTKVWLERRPVSRTLGLLVFGAVVAEIVAVVIAPVAAARLADLVLPSPVYLFAISFAILVGMLIPHVYALFVFVSRRGGLKAMLGHARRALRWPGLPGRGGHR